MGLYEKAVIKTLSYASIFKCPLTQSEIFRFLIWQEKGRPKLPSFLKSLSFLIKERRLFFIKQYYLLEDNSTFLKAREEGQKKAKEKIKIAQKCAKILSLIPTVELIGLSGKLALGISGKEDDIDLLIVTSPKTLWLTRILILIILFLLGVKRNPHEKEVSNRICLNMFIDRDHLKLPKKEQDLFSAHELIQMKPLFERNNCYSNFLNQNQWVKHFLPNTIGDNRDIRILKYKDIKRKKHNFLMSYFELFAQRFQLWYMRKRRTKEVIKQGFVRFHPKDARDWILPEYNKLINKYL